VLVVVRCETQNYPAHLPSPQLKPVFQRADCAWCTPLRMALSNLLDFILTGGQAADITVVDALVPDTCKALVSNKRYDAHRFVASLLGTHNRSIVDRRPCAGTSYIGTFSPSDFRRDDNPWPIWIASCN
jgi:hypothetical protein